ncbi:hypothetical protein TRFO_07288 [Tritrichomonas foetus]|uniref:Uncharacterized protein n=1 Tax=Tritrichomonas foetus TaxID=1144522 RepID=A0A1J4JUE1_9EUKA|nr:hypothetical protein TRFO_07288 [Tritrichomonas foetus]|eukprot:OHT02096.1 hypothetical protein TRFO_07288 [Tritrichomonas foetus]
MIFLVKKYSRQHILFQIFYISMSLRFCYEPLPKVRLIRRQSIRFYVGTPRLNFVTVSKPERISRDSFEIIEHNPRREPKTKDSNSSQTSEPKTPKIKTVQSVSYDKTFTGCYELMKSIRTKKNLRILYDLRDSEIDQKNHFFEMAGDDLNDLSDIEMKLSNCQYEKVDDFFDELIHFFDMIGDIMRTNNPEIAKSARHFISYLESTKNKMVVPKQVVSYLDLKQQLQNFIDIKIPNFQRVVSSHNLEEIAHKLNELDEQKKLRAEWLVKIHCPTLPYYATGIDLKQLPETAIDSLVKLISA